MEKHNFNNDFYLIDTWNLIWNDWNYLWNDVKSLISLIVFDFYDV